MGISLCMKSGFLWNLAPCKLSKLLSVKRKVRIVLTGKQRYVMAAANDNSSSKEVRLYPEKTPLISAFWKEKYEKDAKKYWDIFYKRNANRFFKDRHYLHKEWGQYFSGMAVDADRAVAQTGSGRPEEGRAILEIGCGTGNTVYPLLANYPQAYVYACDFSPRAVDLVKAHEDYDESHVKAFVCDVTSNPLAEEVAPASVDVITLIFVLSAIAPEKMPDVVRNVKSVLKPGGYILLRDYAIGDLAQERFMVKDQQISENFYVRGDGTRAYYFSEDALQSIFLEEGFECKEIKVHSRQLENRSRKIVMDRRWIQAVFYIPLQPVHSRGEKVNIGIVPPVITENLQTFAQKFDSSTVDNVVIGKTLTSGVTLETLVEEENSTRTSEELIVDLTEGCAADLFGCAPPIEPLDVAVGSYIVKAKCLPKENQHTYASTGFMLWESAYAFADLLAANPCIIEGKSVLELGCGSVGLCSLISLVAAKKVVATDGDMGTLSLLEDNLNLNKENFPLERIACHKLEWGNKGDIDNAIAVSSGIGYQLIIGTDVTYVQDAVPLLFKTAKALLMEPTGVAAQEPLLILCHRIRRVSESDIISFAISNGFHVVGLWDSDVSSSSKRGESEIIKHSYVESLFRKGLKDVATTYKALQILCLSQFIE